MSQLNHANIRHRFGKAVRRRQREMDFSQEELAERAGLHRTYISNVERGELNPTLENIERIAIALQLQVSQLFIQYNVDIQVESETE